MYQGIDNICLWVVRKNIYIYTYIFIFLTNLNIKYFNVKKENMTLTINFFRLNKIVA